MGRHYTKDDLGVVSIIEKGAKGDNSFNNDAAFQAAVDEVVAAGGGKVIVPEGIFNVTQFTVPPHDEIRVMIEGTGPRSIIWQTDSTKSPVVLNGTGDAPTARVNDFVMKDICIRGQAGRTGATGHGVHAKYAHRCKFINVMIQDITGDGIRFEGTGYDNAIDKCIIWNNNGVGVKDASASGQITPLWIEGGTLVQGNKLGGIEITSPTFHMNMATVINNGNFDLKAYKKAHGSITNVHFEQFGELGGSLNSVANHPLVILGDAADTSSALEFLFAGCEFYGNRGAQSTGLENLIGIQAVKGVVVNVVGAKFQDLYRPMDAQSTFGHVYLQGHDLINNFAVANTLSTSFMEWRNGNLTFNRGGAITMWTGNVTFNSSTIDLKGTSKITNSDTNGSISFDGKDLTSVKGVIGTGDIQGYNHVFTRPVDTTASAGAASLPATPSGFVQIKVDGNFYKIPLYGI